MLENLYDNTRYLFNPLAIQSLVVALGIIVLGMYALIREQGSRVSASFFLLTLSIGVWLYAFSWMYSAIDERLAMWWAKVAYIGIGSIPAAVYHFSALVLQDYERLKKRVLVIWVLSALFILLILATDIQFKSLYHYSWGFYPKAGVTSIPFILYFFGVMLLALRSYVAGYRDIIRSSVQLRRSRILLIAFVVGSLGLFDFIASFGVPWHPVGYAAMFLFTMISGYSIVRYRFTPITTAFAARQIVDTMNDALIVTDPDGFVRLVNHATCSLFDCREQDLVGKRLAGGLVKIPAFAETLESIIRRGTVSNHEVEYPVRENARRTLSVSVSTVRNVIGEPLASVCVACDISDRRCYEKERDELIVQLLEANEKLKATDKMKSNFISVVSHELRTPLTTIKAFVELIIMKPGMPQEQKAKLLNTLNVETDRLARMISDLLDLDKIDADSMKWRLEKMCIEDVILDSVTSMGPIFDSKALRLTTVLNVPLCGLSGDHDRLVQVVTNILSNAVKFTPTGGAIHIAARQEEVPLPQIVVEISDTGVGIPAGDTERIFEKFHRSGNRRAGVIEGAGLGLAIARQIVEYHGGRMWAESTEGKGSMFTFTLPLEPSSSGIH